MVQTSAPSALRPRQPLADPIAVIFDLDGTLIDSAPDIHAAANRVFEGKGLQPFPFDVVRGFIGNGVGILVSRLLATSGLDSNGPLHAELVRDFINIYEEAVDLTSVYPGAAQALADLQAAGHPMGLCTNKPERPARAALAHFGLDGYFQVVIGGDSLADRKPHPAPLLATVNGLHARRALFVGDSEVDAETAQAAGIPLALFTGGYRKAAPETLGARVIFDHHDALPRLLAHLVPRL
ncbi:MAG: phosphoglycolate phosphatase [Rhodobacterales bacterium]|nr:phosphoglycolate phosphatase [Rhodobacterales bacterium]